MCAKIVDFGTCVALEAPVQRRFVDNPVRSGARAGGADLVDVAGA